MGGLIGTFAYSTRDWPFAAVLSPDVFTVRRLERLHEHVAEKKQRLGLAPALTYDDNLRLRKLMQDLPDEAALYRLYHGFMAQVMQKLAGCALSYSSHPKMRVHLAGTPSVSSFHDDVSVTGRVDQINLWLPFTDAVAEAALWVESQPGAEDYAPVPVRYGEVLVFDGGYLRHGTVANTTETTRVSMDFRCAIRGARTREQGLELLSRVMARISPAMASN